jgi:hypothetical protein
MTAGPTRCSPPVSTSAVMLAPLHVIQYRPMPDEEML